jgi:hypothetical protein
VSIKTCSNGIRTASGSHAGLVSSTGNIGRSQAMLGFVESDEYGDGVSTMTVCWRTSFRTRRDTMCDGSRLCCFSRMPNNQGVTELIKLARFLRAIAKVMSYPSPRGNPNPWS